MGGVGNQVGGVVVGEHCIVKRTLRWIVVEFISISVARPIIGKRRINGRCYMKVRHDC